MRVNKNQDSINTDVEKRIEEFGKAADYTNPTDVQKKDHSKRKTLTIPFSGFEYQLLQDVKEATGQSFNGIVRMALRDFAKKQGCL